MITTVIAITVGSVALVNVLLSQSSSHTVKVESHQSSPSATPVVSITVIPGPTTIPTPTMPDVEEEIEDQLEEAQQKAKEQVDAQRQQAINQINQQFDQAYDQLEDAKLGLPSQATSTAGPMLTQQQQQLNQQRQHMIDQLEQQLQWPY